MVPSSDLSLYVFLSSLKDEQHSMLTNPFCRAVEAVLVFKIQTSYILTPRIPFLNLGVPAERPDCEVQFFSPPQRAVSGSQNLGLSWVSDKEQFHISV
jgi:hypothetical protein